MWLDWFVRYSTKFVRWPMRRVCDECKRHKLKISLSPFLLSSNRNYNSVCSRDFSWKSNRNDRQNKYRSKHLAPTIFTALSSAAMMFSWDRNGISDEELFQGASDEYLLNMSNSEVEEVLLSFGWEKLLIKENLMLFRKYDEDLKLYCYKLFGAFNDITALVFLQVQLDLDYRMKWDDHALKLKVIDSDEKSQSDVVHWVQKFPFPMNSRDYLYVRRYCLDTTSTGPGKVIIKCHSTDHPAVILDKKSVRVQQYESTMIIQSKTKLEEKGMKFLLTYHEDAKASMPTSTYSYLAESGIPSFVEKLHNAAKKLPKSKQFHQIDSLPECRFINGFSH